MHQPLGQLHVPYKAACWPMFALEISYASSDGVTCYAVGLRVIVYR